MKARWTKSVIRQWEETFEYIEVDNPTAARRIGESIFDVIDMLAVHPYAGRVRQDKITRQFAVPRSPYVIAYEQAEDILWVVAVTMTAAAGRKHSRKNSRLRPVPKDERAVDPAEAK